MATAVPVDDAACNMLQHTWVWFTCCASCCWLLHTWVSFTICFSRPNHNKSFSCLQDPGVIEKERNPTFRCARGGCPRNLAQHQHTTPPGTPAAVAAGACSSKPALRADPQLQKATHVQAAVPAVPAMLAGP